MLLFRHGNGSFDGAPEPEVDMKEFSKVQSASHPKESEAFDQPQEDEHDLWGRHVRF